MSALSPELLYFSSRVSSFSTNVFRLETQNQSTATSNSIIAFDLPSNTIVNLRNFKLYAKMNANGTAASGGRLPNGGLKSLIERVEVSMGGVVLSQGTNMTHVLSAAKRAIMEKPEDSVLGHPEMIRATSYVNPADTYATTANENDANTLYCCDEWEGFLGTAEPMLFDLSLVPMLRIRLYMASDNVLSSVATSVLGTADTNFADASTASVNTGPPTNTTAVGSPSYALSDIHATIECISLADMSYENLLSSQLSAQPEGLEVPYKAYYSFMDTHQGSSKFSVASSSLDRVWLAWRGDNYNTVTPPITVGGYKVAGAFVDTSAGAGTTTLDIGAPQYDVGGVLDTNKEKYVGRYFNFSQPVAFGGTTAWKAQISMNSAFYPQFSAGIEEWYGITKSSVESPKNARHMTLDQYRDNFCIQCARFNMPNSEYSRSLTGIDSRATNLAGIVNTTNTSLNPNLSIFVECTEILRIGAGRSISVVV